jgi:hypothetical protein
VELLDDARHRGADDEVVEHREQDGEHQAGQHHFQIRCLAGRSSRGNG